MPPTRHLTRALAEATLHRGRAIEQLLSVSNDREGRRRIKWVTISSGADGEFSVRVHDVLDPGFPAFFDVSEFPPTDDDESIGDGRLVATHSVAAAIAAAGGLGAVPDRWVIEGLIGHEYSDAIDRT